jgi:hypothetical protein
MFEDIDTRENILPTKLFKERGLIDRDRGHDEGLVLSKCVEGTPGSDND